MSTSCYTDQCVVVFGTASLQRYVFQSNSLKENIGASYLAKYWLNGGLIEAIRQARFPIYTSSWNEYTKTAQSGNDLNCLEPRSTNGAPVNWIKPVELIYVGGGNAALLCKNQDIAREIVRAWSRKLLEHAPGIRVTVGYGKVKSSLSKAYRKALDNLALCEEALPFGYSIQSLPVVRTCTSTGLPASESRTEPGEGIQWIAQSAASKRDQVNLKGEPGAAQEHIKKIFPSVLKRTDHLPELNRFAIKLDEELGGRKGESHIAVVHADGNGMGDLLNQVINKKGQGDDVFLHNLRAFSASTAALSHKALEKTLLHFKTFLPLKESLHNSDEIFPLRPIVFGGDDLTFVCDGRVGLHLAAYYLNQFANNQINFCGDKISVDACAGVAIVHTKFPFARAYDFADDLCKEAKKHRREDNKKKRRDQETGSWLDFQIIQEGATRSITELREAQYRSLEGQVLHQRPYEVPEKWDDFIAILKEFLLKWPRTRAKELLQAFTQGPTVTSYTVDRAKSNDLELPSVKDTQQSEFVTGWTTVNTTRYFDPLRVLDFYLKELLPK